MTADIHETSQASRAIQISATSLADALREQASTLDERIKSIALSDQTIEEIKDKQGGKAIRDALLGSFIIGKVAKVLVDWNEGSEKAIKDAKREFVISSYLNKVDGNTHAISALKNFVTDPVGNTLFNKIMSISDDSPPDQEQLDHLSSAIKTIIESDFRRLFSQHKFALSQIEFMTPQAMTILADHRQWPEIYVAGYSYSGSKITSNYDSEFAQTYARSRGIDDPKEVDRVHHCIN